MTDLLWQKPGVTVDVQIQAFLAGDDVILDREFFLHDIAASRAHAQGLQRIGIIDAAELAALERELGALAEDFSSGAFILDTHYEDGHSAIEARLTERLGDTGRRIHTGRSRVATRI
jgi:argininosuccinate lyase